VAIAKALALVPLRLVAVSVENGLAVVTVVVVALDTPLLLEPCTRSAIAVGNRGPRLRIRTGLLTLLVDAPEVVVLAALDAGNDVLTTVEPPLTVVVNTYGALGMLPCEA